jgi:hypothetical protein
MGLSMAVFTLRVIKSALGLAVGVLPGVVYYATEMTGPVPSLALVVLGGFAGLA